MQTTPVGMLTCKAATRWTAGGAAHPEGSAGPRSASPAIWETCTSAGTAGFRGSASSRRNTPATRAPLRLRRISEQAQRQRTHVVVEDHLVDPVNGECTRNAPDYVRPELVGQDVRHQGDGKGHGEGFLGRLSAEGHSLRDLLQQLHHGHVGVALGRSGRFRGLGLVL
ncbi:MLO-like protein 8 [Babesia caballi]|uniref:MLO-like protein 8 n=1 Tax=Babesia caballi TaxID=5871 RepID=A0AAV4M215_BABCB|nr:MLO-like protein 8 [Babesia caballi]